jgi:serine protease
MKSRIGFAAVAASVALLAGLAFVSVHHKVASIYSDPANKAKPVVGLVLKYQDGIAPFDLFGNQVAIGDTKYQLNKGVDLGLGMYSVDFKNSVNEYEALKIAATLVNDERVESIYLNHMLTDAVFREVAPRLAVLKASSAPANLQATDSWTNQKPNSARVTLTWLAPSKLNGGTIWGYRVWKFDPVANTYKILISNSKSSATSLLVSNNLVAGATASFKVAAITRSTNLKYMAVSAASTIAKVTPTATPQAPVLQSSGTITSTSPVVIWALQDKIGRGGLPVNYTVTATATDSSTSTCTTSANTCSLSGLSAGKTYTVQVTATNSRGSSTSAIVEAALDPMISMQWYLNSTYGVNASEAWKITKGSPSIVVAVVDTGITDHPDLNDNVVPGYDFISNASQARDGNGRDADPSDPGDYNLTDGTPSSWHGTHVAGIIAASSNSIGITGIAPNVKIEPVRVLGANGGTEADIAAGINWAIGVKISGIPTNQFPAKVVNLSIGSSDFSTCYSNSPTQLAIDESKRRNVTLVTAAGNDNHYATASYPGNCYGNITIGATGYTGDRSYYSNYSGYSQSQGVFIGVDISAPGGDDRAGLGAPAGGQIWSTLNDGLRSPGTPTYGKEEGTSMASPIAAGVVALMYSVRPSLTDDQVWSILSSTAKEFSSSSDCTAELVQATLNTGEKVTTGLCGVGIIDAAAAVKAVQSLNK